MKQLLLCILSLMSTVTIVMADNLPAETTITLPAVEGTTISPAPGKHTVTIGKPFTFYVRMDSEYNESQIVTYLNGDTLKSYFPDDIAAEDLYPDTYYYKIDPVLSEGVITIEGVEKNREIPCVGGVIEVDEEGTFSVSFSTMNTGVYRFIIYLYESTDAGLVLINRNVVEPNPEPFRSESIENVTGLIINTEKIEKGKKYMVKVEGFTYDEIGQQVILLEVTTPIFTWDDLVSNTTISDTIRTCKVTANNGLLYIETAIPQTVEVYSISGTTIAKRQVNGSLSIPLNKGFYIVKAGGTVHKVMIR